MNLAPSRKIKFAFEFLFSFYVLTFLMKGYNIFTCYFLLENYFSSSTQAFSHFFYPSPDSNFFKNLP